MRPEDSPPSNPRQPRSPHRRAFTLIELLVVIAIIALLIGILLPALGSAALRARIVADASQLRQLSVATQMYLDDHNLALPQYLVNGFDGNPTPVGSLFGGKKGDLPLLDIHRVGAQRRPLNSYLLKIDPPPDLTPSGEPTPDFHIPVFESPIDAGGSNLPVPGFNETDSMYELLGSSYTLNDHAPDENPAGDDFPTLVPPKGGPMPPLVSPTQTVLIANHAIYNYDDGGDENNNRNHNWFNDANQTRSNIAFADAHVKTAIPVPPGMAHTTTDYTFLPTPDWLGDRTVR